MAYTKLLVAYDGSEQSIRALKTAMDMAGEWNASLEVVHSYQIPIVVLGEAMIPPPVDTSAAIAVEAENLAEEVKSILNTRPGIRADVTVVQGEAGRSILEAAHDKGADLIVIGSRGNSGLKEMFLGSVSHYIIQHSKIAVHVIK
jgi:nucleotide-binding universal stress UspA family protein